MKTARTFLTQTGPDILCAMVLIVPLLIAILVPWPLRFSPSAPIRMEVNQLAMALTRYQQEYGEYPPDFSSGNATNAIDEHLAKAFPDRDRKQDVPDGIEDLSPENALYFWLKGFSSDPLQPLTGDGPRDPFFEFDDVPEDGRFNSPNKIPYLYFNSRTYKTVSFRASNGEIVRPYLSSITGTFVDAGRFQIIDAGLDQRYGEGSSVYPSESMPPEKLDNVTSFSESSTLAN